MSKPEPFNIDEEHIFEVWGSIDGTEYAMFSPENYDTSTKKALKFMTTDIEGRPMEFLASFKDYYKNARIYHINIIDIYRLKDFSDNKLTTRKKK